MKMQYSKVGPCTYIALIFIACFASIVAKGNDVVLENKKFAFKYLSEYPNPKAKYNTIISPLALKWLLLATAFSSKRDTKAQLLTLRPKVTIKELKEGLYRPIDDINRSLRIFVNNLTDVSYCVREHAGKYIQHVDFTTKESNNEIIEWIQNASSNIIFDKIDDDYSKHTFFKLAHVEKVHGHFKVPFPNILKKGTKVGNKVLKSNMINQDNTFLYADLKDLDAEAIELHLTNNVKLLILSPHVKDINENFVFLKQQLLNTDIDELRSKLQPTELSLYLPILDGVKCIREARSALNHFNITLPFTISGDLSKLHRCADDSYIHRLYQNSRINVNQQGISIASLTDMRLTFVDEINRMVINSEDSEESEFTDEDNLVDVQTKILVAPKKELKAVIVQRYLFMLFKDEIPIFLGTMVKPHNFEEARRRA